MEEAKVRNCVWITCWSCTVRWQWRRNELPGLWLIPELSMWSTAVLSRQLSLLAWCGIASVGARGLLWTARSHSVDQFSSIHSILVCLHIQCMHIGHTLLPHPRFPIPPPPIDPLVLWQLLLQSSVLFREPCITIWSLETNNEKKMCISFWDLIIKLTWLSAVTWIFMWLIMFNLIHIY